MSEGTFRPGTAPIRIRLGNYDEERFVPGVFEQLEREMEDAGLVAEETPVEIVDYFYRHGARGQTARTRVSYDAASMQMHREHVQEQTQCSVVASRVRPSRRRTLSTCGDRQGCVVNACRGIAIAREDPLLDPPRRP